MKWVTVSVVLVFLIGFTAAHTGDHSDFPNPGTTPGSPFFGLEQAQESISLALTFNKEKKAHKRLYIAQERLSEARKLSENNDSANAEKAVKMHISAMERANQSIQGLSKDRRGNASNALKTTQNQSITVLEDLKQKLPEAAQKGINNAIQAHEKGQRNRKDSNLSQRPERTQSRGYAATGRVVGVSS